VVATFLNAFVNNAHIVKMANLAQMVNVIAPIFTNDNGIFLQTIYYPLQLFAMHSQGTALDLFVDSPKYATKQYGDIPYLDTSAALNNGTLVLNVVNRSKDQAITAEVEAEDKQFSGKVTVTEVNGPDIKAENDFGSQKVGTTQKSADAQGKKLTYTFAPHSFTVLQVKLA